MSGRQDGSKKEDELVVCVPDHCPRKGSRHVKNRICRSNVLGKLKRPVFLSFIRKPISKNSLVPFSLCVSGFYREEVPYSVYYSTCTGWYGPDLSSGEIVFYRSVRGEAMHG